MLHTQWESSIYLSFINSVTVAWLKYCMHECVCVCTCESAVVHEEYSFPLLKKYIRCLLNNEARSGFFFLFISQQLFVSHLTSCRLLNVINNFDTMVAMLSRNVNTRNCFEPFELFHSIYWFAFSSDSDKRHWKYSNQWNSELNNI